MCKFVLGGVLSSLLAAFVLAASTGSISIAGTYGSSASSGTLAQVGPEMAAATNFGHGWQPEVLRDAIRLGVGDFRDIIYWEEVENEPRTYLFEKAETTYPAEIAAAGGRMSLTVNWGNELYDNGDTPFTPEGRAALARFVVATLDAYPAIHAVEVGNEFNGPNFVKGPVKNAVRSERATEHFKLLKTIYQEVKPRHPEVAVLGGAAHSIPGGYLWPLLDLGGSDYMDALALHPYTTSPEQLGRQIAVLRRHPKARSLPLQVTEFGNEARVDAPGYLIRMYCAMALSGVERVVWYPLNERGDGKQPLIDSSISRPTPVGRAFALAQANLAGMPVRDVSPDPFTYACLFGDSNLVIWGEPREVFVQDGIDVTNAIGVALDPVLLELSMTEPLLATSEEPIVLNENLRLGPTTIIADSYHQFAYPQEGKAQAPSDPFQRFAQRTDRRIKLTTLEGQDAPGTPWTPYLGNRYARPVRVTAESVVPGGTAEDPVEIVHRYVAGQAQDVAVEAEWMPSTKSSDGIDVTIRLVGEELFHKTGIRDLLEVSLPRVVMKKGDRLDFIVGPGRSADGDPTNYRITLREAE